MVKDNRVIATGMNLVTASNDPTAHAEVVAIRAACQELKIYQLNGCEIYCSCEPCPMCLGAIYWSRLARFYFSATRQDAAKASFDDSFIYNELPLAPEQRSIPGVCLPAEDRAAAVCRMGECSEPGAVLTLIPPGDNVTLAVPAETGGVS